MQRGSESRDEERAKGGRPLSRSLRLEAAKPAPLGGRKKETLKTNPTPYSERRAAKRSALLEERARAMRAERTPTERLLWNELRAGKLGVRFVRQVVMGDSILDFYCAEKKLAIEVDGRWHRSREANDDRRDEKLRRLAVRVLRFSSEEVECDLGAVVRRVVGVLRGEGP